MINNDNYKVTHFYFYSEYNYDDENHTFAKFIIKQKVKIHKRSNKKLVKMGSNVLEIYNLYEKYIEYYYKKQQIKETTMINQMIPIKTSNNDLMLLEQVEDEYSEKKIFDQEEKEIDSIKSVFCEYMLENQKEEDQITMQENSNSSTFTNTTIIEKMQDNEEEDFFELQELLPNYTTPITNNNNDLFTHNPKKLITFADKILYVTLIDFLCLRSKQDVLKTNYQLDYFDNLLILLVDYSNNQKKYLISYKFSQKRLTCKNCGVNYHKKACCDKHKNKFLLHSDDEKEIELILSTLTNKYHSKSKKLMCLLFINEILD